MNEEIRLSKTDKLKRFLIEHPGSRIREIAVELYGDTSSGALRNTRGIIQHLRNRLKKDRQDLYCIKGGYKILNGKDYVEFGKSHKERVGRLLNTLNDVIERALDSSPEHSDDLMQILKGCLRQALDIEMERSLQSANNKLLS